MIRNYDQQALAAFSQVLRTLGVAAVYVNAVAASKSIKVIFRNREGESDNEVTRVVAPQPAIRVLESDIDDRDTTTATFTINGTTYYADEYISNSHGQMKIFLRM
ncbi:MAG: hypothetical protein KAS66_00310 [Candidatus Omnitrophica bacterium]|nr:hypothetical protein [Candidatus Omnitrophota bacterium]